nr:MAG TPA: mHsp60, mHsp10, Mitochondrial, Chaperonin, Complex, Symmetric [Caudoviricetes sp.]
MANNMKMYENSTGTIVNAILGADTNAQTMILDEKYFDEKTKREQSSKIEQDINDIKEKYEKHLAQLEEDTKQIQGDFNKLEIMPLTSYVLIKPFESNPFQKINKLDSGLIIDSGGIAPSFKSQETGDMIDANQYIKVGLVTEVGTECKFLKPGDVVFYNIASEVQVPFFKFGFVIVAEQRILAVVNEGLTDRKLDVQSKMTKD